jgi:hypothetical protein
MMRIPRPRLLSYAEVTPLYPYPLDAVKGREHHEGFLAGNPRYNEDKYRLSIQRDHCHIRRGNRAVPKHEGCAQQA